MHSRVLSSCLLPAILLAYLADVVHGLTVGDTQEGGTQLGPLIRGVVLLIACAAVLLRPRWNKYSTCTAFLMAGVAVVAVTRGVLWNWDALLLTSELAWLVKLVYGPVLFMALFDARRNGQVSARAVRLALLAAGVILSSLVLLPGLVGLGHLTYTWGVGSTGLLTAQNDVGLGLALLVPALVWYVYRGRVAAGLVLSLVLVACVFIGTRTGVLAPLVLTTASIAVVLIDAVRRSDGLSGRVAIRLTAAACFVLMAAAASGTWYIVTSDKAPRQIEKFQSTFEGNTNRGLMRNAAVSSFMAQPEWTWTIGTGRAEMQAFTARELGDDRPLRSVELDWADLVAGFGLPFTVLLSCGIAAALFVWLTFWLMSGGGPVGITLLSMGAWLGHGVLAGHALASPVPTTSLVLVLVSVLLPAVGHPRLPRGRNRAI